jgi:hypothetical protein
MAENAPVTLIKTRNVRAENRTVHAMATKRVKRKITNTTIHANMVNNHEKTA